MPSSTNDGAMDPSAPQHDLNCLTIAELQSLAHERMDKQTRDYYNEGADSGSTLLANYTSYDNYRIVPRVLRDISTISTSVPLFSDKQSTFPFGVAPTAMQRLAHDDGEVATARACRSAGVPMGLSSFSTSTLEDVAEASDDNARVLQLYLFEERLHSQKLIERAKRAGYKAVFLTVDTPMLGRRNLEIRNQFKLPSHLNIPNFPRDQEAEGENEESLSTTSSSAESTRTATPSSNQKPNISRARTASTPGKPHPQNRSIRILPSGPITFHTHAANPTLTWSNAIPWLKSTAHPMQVWVKGILSPQDAQLALEHGADGIVVSNHGGRQLDGAISTLDALPGIVDVVKRRIPVHVDGGIRHGSQIFKALALGADFVWVGRPVLWGLAYKGQEGVELALRLLGDEFRLCMGLAGCCKVEDINKEYLVRVEGHGRFSKL